MSFLDGSRKGTINKKVEQSDNDSSLSFDPKLGNQGEEIGMTPEAVEGKQNPVNDALREIWNKQLAVQGLKVPNKIVEGELSKVFMPIIASSFR